MLVAVETLSMRPENPAIEVIFIRKAGDITEESSPAFSERDWPFRAASCSSCAERKRGP